MFWSEKYNAYAFLVVSGDNESQVKDAATAAIVEATAEKQTVTYNSDINGTGNVDINDAQLVYNMYNAMYDDFTDVTMEKFLKADVNRDKTVNVNDAAAVGRVERNVPSACFSCHFIVIFCFAVCHFFDKYFLCVSCVCVIIIGQCWISAEQGVRLNREPGENPGGKTPLYAYRNCTCRKTVTGRPGRPCRDPLRCNSEELLQ